MNFRQTLPLPPRPNVEAVKRLYRSEVLGLPGPTDCWLTTNERACNISFLSNYFLLHDLTNVENVMCRIQREYNEASSTSLSVLGELTMSQG